MKSGVISDLTDIENPYRLSRGLHAFSVPDWSEMYEMYGVVDVLTVLLLSPTRWISGGIVNRLKYDAKNSIHIYIYIERERQIESSWHHILTRLTRNRSLPKFTGWAIVEARSIRRRLRTFRISREQKTMIISIVNGRQVAWRFIGHALVHRLELMLGSWLLSAYHAYERL